MLRRRAQQRAQPVGLGVLVAQVVGLVDDHHVDQGLLQIGLVQQTRQACCCRVGGLVLGVPAARWANALQAGNEGELLPRLALDLFELLQQLVCIHDAGLDAKAVGQFALPLVAQHGRADHQQAARILARLQFRPNQAGLNGLTQADLVGNQDSVGGRVQKLQHRLELVGQELRVGGVHAVDQVGQLAAEPVVGDGTAQVVGSAITALLDQFVRSGRLFLHLFQRTGQKELFSAVQKVHKHPLARRRAVGLVAQDANAAWVGFQPDSVTGLHVVLLAEFTKARWILERCAPFLPAPFRQGMTQEQTNAGHSPQEPPAACAIYPFLPPGLQ